MKKFTPIVMVLLASCARLAPLPTMPMDFAKASAQAMSVCELIAKRESFEGKAVTVKGFLSPTPHGRLLSSSERQCSRDIGIQLTAGGFRKTERFEKAVKRETDWRQSHVFEVVVSGTFKAEHFMPSCKDEGCYSFNLVDSEILSGRRTWTGMK